MKNPLYLKVLIDSDLDPLEIDNLKSEIEGLVGVLEVEKAAQQSAQADEADEIDPVAQALRNLGGAIAPPRR